MDSKRFKNMEEFILNYRTAESLKLPIEKLADILDLKPDSVERRRLSIKHNMGLELPHLPRVIDSSLKGRDAVPVTEDEYNDFVAIKQKFIDTKEKFELKEVESKKRVYVITAAQNATPVHEGFWASLQQYIEARDAELMVIPLRYRNPTSIWTVKNQENDYWDTRLVPYITDRQIKLNDRMMVAGQMKIQPTAVSPLSGLDAYTGELSGIFGHTSVELKTIPTPARTYPKLLSTTGAVTIPNYTDTKTGHKGKFNHSLSACIVEIDGDMFHHRHVHADSDTGEFYDLDKLYTPYGVKDTGRITALVTGDIHAEFHDPNVEKATYTNSDSIMNVLRPEVWVAHDITDFYARNHHHRGNDLLKFAKHHFGRDNVEEGLQVCADFLDKHARPDMLNLVVRSNHDEALDRWLREADPKLDPENAVFYHYMKMHQYKNVKMHETGFDTFDALEFWCNNPESQRGLRNKDNTKFLKRDEHFVVNGIELSFHGDQGSNGGPGSRNTFAKIGPKTIIGHGHCLTEDHSVLTKDQGWKKIQDITREDYVLTYGKDGYNEFASVDDTFKFNYSGTLITVGNGKWYQEVTSKHNMYLDDHSYIPVTEAIVTRTPGEIPLSAKGFKDSVDTSDKLQISNDDIRKIVALCADGSIQEGKWIRFHLKKERKIERLKELFGNDLREPNKTFNDNYKVSLRTGSDSYHMLEKFVDFSDKKLPDSFRLLSNFQKELFLEELQYWDGTLSSETSANQFNTAKIDEAYLVSAIATELGYRNTCTLRHKHKKRMYSGIYHVSWCSDRTYQFCSRENDCDKTRIDNWRVKTREVDNHSVYCISTKNNNFWVKHDDSGTVSLTGNSPGVFQGCFQVGVSARINLEYASGCSSWMHTHALVYPNGRRTLIHVVNGKWRL